MEMTVKMEIQGHEAVPVAQAVGDHPVFPVCQDQRDTEDFPADPVLREIKANLEIGEN